MVNSRMGGHLKSSGYTQNTTKSFFEKNQKINAAFKKLNAFLKSYGVKIEGVLIYLISIFTITYMTSIQLHASQLKASGAGVFFSVVLTALILTSRQRAKINDIKKHFPKMLSIISRRLKSGGNLREALHYASEEVSNNDWAEELKRIYAEISAGGSLDKALEKSAKRVNLPEHSLFCSVISIQAQLGGKLANIIESIAKLIQDKDVMTKKMRAMIAQSKASAYFIASLPILGGVLMYVRNPAAFYALAEKPVGLKILLVAGMGYLVGLIILKNLVKLK